MTSVDPTERAVANTAAQIYLNASRDADVDRKQRARRALADWSTAGSADERDAAARLVRSVAAEYGLARS